MGWDDIIWTAIAGVVGLLSLTAAIAHRRPLATVSSAERRAPAREEPAEDRTAHDERRRLTEAKTSAEKAYAQRVTVAEREFTSRKHRADVHLRAAEMFLEHAQEYSRISRVDMGRRQRILDARAHLADAMLEHRLVVTAAEKLLADARAEAGDVLAATSALEAFDDRKGTQPLPDSERPRR